MQLPDVLVLLVLGALLQVDGHVEVDLQLAEKVYMYIYIYIEREREIDR